MSVIKKVDVETAEELIGKLSPRDEMWRFDNAEGGDDPSAWVFRGQSNSAWDLVPSAWRSDGGQWTEFPAEYHPAHPISFHHIQQCEVKLLKKFFLLADAQSLPLPEDSQTMRGLLFDQNTSAMSLWPSSGLLSLLAVAQHYGVPTRLLDWTRDAKIAAYFAAKGALEDEKKGKTKPDQKIGVWALHKQVFKGDYQAGKPIECVTAPMSAIPNLHAQGGLFSIVRLNRIIPGSNKALATVMDYTTPLDKIVTFIYGLSRMAFMVHITLPIRECSKLLRFLKEELYTASRLFPGYDGVTKCMKEMSFYDRLSYIDANPDIEL